MMTQQMENLGNQIKLKKLILKFQNTTINQKFTRWVQKQTWEGIRISELEIEIIVFEEQREKRLNKKWQKPVGKYQAWQYFNNWYLCT